ncbi:MAG: glutaredoxin 3 [Candidatus Pelagibacter sp.]|nr:glutaredoxin 3 [Candidatus Pelagibacter sp.]
MKIIIYTTPYCPYCIRAKRLLKKKNVIFEEINLYDKPEKMDEMIKKSNGAKTVPQLFVDETHIGDCDQIYELDNNGELDKILNKK